MKFAMLEHSDYNRNYFIQNSIFPHRRQGIEVLYSLLNNCSSPCSKIFHLIDCKSDLSQGNYSHTSHFQHICLFIYLPIYSIVQCHTYMLYLTVFYLYFAINSAFTNNLAKSQENYNHQDS
jgi:hypothetical protein